MATNNVYAEMALQIEEVKGLLNDGHSCSEIAEMLRIPESTVRSYKRVIDQSK